jgi:hypothetical protein
MRTSLLFLALALVNHATVALSSVPRSKYSYTNRAEDLSDYLNQLAPAAKNVLINGIAGPSIGADVKLPASLLDVLNTYTILSSQPGVLITVLPEPDRPDYLIYWARDAYLAYHAWFIELVLSPKNILIRALLDDYVHAIVRTQHVVNIAGNTFSGGLDEALFDLKLGVITNPSYRVGSPAAGMFIAPHIRSPLFNVHSTFQTGHRSAPYT